MNEGKARQLVFFSLILSLISFILSLIAYFLPNWKYIQLRTAISSSTLITEYHHMDPLILGEVDKFTEFLYPHGLVHSFGLMKHCMDEKTCGFNLLLLVNQTNYKHCHQIKSHYDCIYSPSLMSDKCICQKPEYIHIISTLLFIIFWLKAIILIISFIRSSDYHVPLKDLYLRIFSIISHLIIIVFLIFILIEQNRHRLYETLYYFHSMHRYYSELQIYSFAKNLELILEKIQDNFDINLGASYTCIIFVLIFTVISFLLSSIVEVKRTSLDDEDITMHAKPNLISTQHTTHRSVPSTPMPTIRHLRQTKV